MAPRIQAVLATLSTGTRAPLQHFTLANGLTVYLQEDTRSPLACAQIWYQVGSVQDLPGSTNLTHVLEHMLFEGSHKLAPGQYSRIIHRLSGSNGASTLEDATTYEMQLPAAYLEVALELMADTMANATLDSSALAKAIKAVDDERRLKIDNSPLQQAFAQHLRLAHGDSPYGNPSFGEPDDLKELTPAAVRTWYRTWYHPNNAILVIIGNVARQQVQDWVERYFGGWAAAPLQISAPYRQPASLQMRQQALVLPGAREGVLVSFNVPSLGTAESGRTVPALRLALELLAAGSSSVLFGNLVRDEQILSGISADYDFDMRGDTLVNLYAYNNPDQATPTQASDAIWGNIESFIQLAPSAKSLQRAKLNLLTRQHKALAEEAQAIGMRAISGLDPSLLNNEHEALATVTAEEVQLAAATFFTPQRMTITQMLAPALPAKPAPLTLNCADTLASVPDADFSGLSSAQQLDLDHLRPEAPQVQAWRTAQGSQVAFVEAHGSPTFELQLRFLAGTCQDTDLPGMAALTAYMLDQGSDGLDAQAFAERLSAAAASIKTQISHDYAMLTLSGHSAPALRNEAGALLTAMVARPTFEASAFEGIRARLLRYLIPREQTATARADLQLLSRVFDGHVYGQEVGGTSAGVGLADVAALRAFHQRQYTAKNLQVTLVGALSREDAQDLVQGIASALPAHTTDAAKPVPVQPLKAPQSLHIERPGSNVKVKLAWPLNLSPGDPDHARLMIANEILGASFESRLNIELRERRALTYSITAYSKSYQAGGLLCIAWDIEPAILNASVDLVRLMIRCFIEHGPTVEEVRLAVSQLKGELLTVYADNHELASDLVKLNTHQLPSSYYSTYLEQLAQATPGDVKAVAARLLAPAGSVLVSVGPAAEQQALPPLPAGDQ